MGPEWYKFISAALTVLLIFNQYCFAAKAPFSSFAKDATSAPPEGFYDYIIIGGGTAGCALAATLSEKSSVLLLERGGLPYGNENINSTHGFAASLADVSPSSASQLFISTDGVVNHRARVLGGGTALNAGFYSRASNEYVKQAGWDQKLVEESYQWVENKVVFKPTVLEWQSAFKDGLLEAGVSPDSGFTYDHLAGTKVGGTIFDKDGYRHTAANLLEYANPSNIAVHLNAVVQQILFKTEGQPKPRAHGVAFADANGQRHVANLNEEPTNEIILSAGAIGSPQLLMLSGVGPADHLKTHNIEVVLDQRQVGQGMSDNPMNAILIPSLRPVEFSLVQVAGITQHGSFVEAISGSYDLDWIRRMASSFGIKTGPMPFGGAFGQWDSSLFHSNAGVIIEKVIGPLSSGQLELLTTNPNDNPKVTFNYFQDPKDLERCVHGMNTIIKVIESESFSKFRNLLMPTNSLISLMLALPINLRPRHLTSAVSMEQFCKDTVMTIWHYHGGCQVDKVVDQDLKVLGVDALRVVDGSVFIDSPGTNPQATVMMLGRCMGQKILQGRFSGGTN